MPKTAIITFNRTPDDFQINYNTTGRGSLTKVQFYLTIHTGYLSSSDNNQLSKLLDLYMARYTTQFSQVHVISSITWLGPNFPSALYRHITRLDIDTSIPNQVSLLEDLPCLKQLNIVLKYQSAGQLYIKNAPSLTHLTIDLTNSDYTICLESRITRSIQTLSYKYNGTGSNCLQYLTVDHLPSVSWDSLQSLSVVTPHDPQTHDAPWLQSVINNWSSGHQLKEIVLKCNLNELSLFSLPSTVQQVSLARIKNVLWSMERLANLTVLDLAGVDLDQDHLIIDSTALSTLRLVSLKCSKLQIQVPSLKSCTIANCSSLSHLNIQPTTDSLALTINTCTRLESFNIDQHYQQLEILELANCHCVELLSMFELIYHKLQKLSLSGCTLASSIDFLLPAVQYVDIINCHCDPLEVMQFHFNHLNEVKRLTVMNIPQLKCLGVHYCPQLTELVLYGCPGLSHLYTAHTPRLKLPRLSDNINTLRQAQVNTSL